MMPFSVGLRDSLQLRQNEAASELAKGDSLERVLSRHLLTVEDMADGDLLTSILLLDFENKKLWHGAAPNLPRAYCQSIDGGDIGPSAGSCGTAAYLGRPVYVPDIASDPLWDDYRDVALAHGLRACWSTPIRDTGGAVIGTFAIYHRTVGSPTQDEIQAIQLITDHVAEAIMGARNTQDEQSASSQARPRPTLTLVSNEEPADPEPQWAVRLLNSVEKLQTHTENLDRRAETTQSEKSREALRAAAADCRRLISVIRSHIDRHKSRRSSGR